MYAYNFLTAQGPEECGIAVENIELFSTVTEQRQVDVIILSEVSSRYGLKSVLVSLKGAEVQSYRTTMVRHCAMAMYKYFKGPKRYTQNGVSVRLF